MTEALPRGNAQKTTIKRNPKKVFGFKNKVKKQKASKKFIPKIPSKIKASDYAQGCITLASVRSVEDDSVYFDLPGGVHGVLYLSEVNDHFLEHLKHAVETQSSDLPALEDFFKFGDFVTAVVLSQGTHPVELSVRPSLLNVGINVEEGQIMFGAIKSKADHGYMVDIGNKVIEGFLPTKEKNLKIGKPVIVKVTALSSPQLVRVELFQEDKFYPTNKMKKCNFDLIRPFNVIDSVVQSNVANGALKLMVGGSFQGICSRFSWDASLNEGDHTLARPLLIDPAQKTLWMSTVPTIVNGEKPLCFYVNLGTKETTKVLRIRSNVGIECGMLDDKLRVFIDIKKTKSETTLVAGDDHYVRITERRPLDDLLFATDDPEIIDLKVFCAEDVKVGEVYDAVVKQIHPKFGVFVKLSPFLVALANHQNCDDISKLTKGTNVKVIVLAINKSQVKIAIKEKLINSQYPKVLTYDDAKQILESKQFTHAIIKKVVKSAILVEFFNNLVGIIPAAYLPLEKGTDATKLYQVGHIIKTRIISIDGDKINCSVIADDESVLTLGLRLTVTVTGFTENAAKVTLPSKYGTFEAIIPDTHFADDIELSKKIFQSLRIGRRLHNCILVRFAGVSVPAVLTRKRCIRDNAKTIPKSNEEIKENESYFGYVTGNQNCGSFISFFGRSSGLAHNIKMEIGESVHAVVQKNENGRIALTLPSDAGESTLFMYNFLKDCRELSPIYSIGDEVTIENEPEESDNMYTYKLNEEWTGISQLKVAKDEKLYVAYADVLTNTVILDKFDVDNLSLEINSTVQATIIAICNPIIVAKYNNIILLAPITNYNNRRDYSDILHVGSQISLLVSELKGSVYISVPSFHFQNNSGNTLTGKIQSIDEIYATVMLEDMRIARVHKTQLPDDAKEGDTIKGTLINGTNALYIQIDPSMPLNIDDFKEGQQVCGIVTKFFQNSMKLSLSPFTNGSISVLQFSNSDRKNASKTPDQIYSIGEKIKGWVKSVHKKFVVMTLIDPKISENTPFAKVVEIHQGDYAIVSLDVGDKRRLDVIDVSDEFKFNPLRNLKVGQVIDVVNIPGKDKNVSTKQSAFEGNFKSVEIKEGNVVQGYITSHKKNYFLVRIDTGVTGVLPLNRLADSFIRNPKDLYPIGSVITVKIDKIDEKKIILTSRKSDIDGKVLTFEDLKVGDKVEGFITGSGPHGVFVSLRDYHQCSGLIHHSKFENFSPEEWATFVNSKVIVEIEEIDTEKKRINLKLIESEKNEVSEEEESESTDEEVQLNEIDLDFNEQDDDEDDKSVIPTKHKQTEEDITNLEAKQINPSAPKSAEEFNKLLFASPNSSYLWVEFIKFYYENGNIEEAKATAERALERLPIGDVKEKINVWITYINLFVLTASDKTFIQDVKPIVQKAAASTRKKEIWKHFGIFVSANKKEFAQEAWKLALKQCKGSLKVWISYLKTLMNEGKTKEASDEYKRGLESFVALGSSKQWKFTEQYSILQFKHNNVEVGRTLFEHLIQDKPKQYEFWNVYIDMEAKYGDIDHTRALFDRLANTELSADRMRATLKKWIEFEKRNGDDPSRKAYIKELAMKYRASNQ